MSAGNENLDDKAKGDLGFFDRFAEVTSGLVSRAPFFAFCVLLIVVWAPSYFLFGSLDTWQLVINTATTIITFLLVALIQNSTKRAENATNFKLNVIADALADLIEAQAEDASNDALTSEMIEDARLLREAMGIEQQMSA